MPVIVDGQPMPPPSSVSQFISFYPNIQQQARQFRSLPPTNVDPNEPYLFILQNEIACVSGEDPNVHYIGLDELTTCCALVIRHSGSGAMGAGHFDELDTKAGIDKLLSDVSALTREWAVAKNLSLQELHSQYNYEIHLVGGFDDIRGISLDVAMQLLDSLSKTGLDLHLKTACLCSSNTYYQDNLAYPCVTGVLCSVRTGHVLPASFTFRGPLEEIRRLRAVGRRSVMHSVYDPFLRVLEIKPYNLVLTDDTIQQLLGLNTNSFLHYWSTSPLAEMPNFVPAYKSALKYIKDNRSSIFKGGKSYKFIRTNNQWKQMFD